MVERIVRLKCYWWYYPHTLKNRDYGSPIINVFQTNKHTNTMLSYLIFNSLWQILSFYFRLSRTTLFFWSKRFRWSYPCMEKGKWRKKLIRFEFPMGGRWKAGKTVERTVSCNLLPDTVAIVICWWTWLPGNTDDVYWSTYYSWPAGFCHC